MVSTRLTALAVAVGLVAGAVGCSSGAEVTSTGGPVKPGTTVLRFAGTSIIAEPAGAAAATAVGGLIGPPPTPSTTTTTTTAPPVTSAPVVTFAPTVTQPGPTFTAPPQTQQTVTFTVPPTTPPTIAATTKPAKPPPLALDVNALTPDEKVVLAKLNEKKGGVPLILESAATATAKFSTQKVIETKANYPFPGPLFDFVNANYTLLTSGVFAATTVPLLADAAATGLGGSLTGITYVGLSIGLVNGNPWVTVILGT